MNMVDPNVVVLVAILAVNIYIARVVYEIAQKFLASKAQATADNWYGTDDDEDELFEDALAFVLEKKKCSTSLLQRRFRVGYGRSARLLDRLADDGVIEWQPKPSPGRWVVSEEYIQAKKEEEAA